MTNYASSCRSKTIRPLCIAKFCTRKTVGRYVHFPFTFPARQKKRSWLKTFPASNRSAPATTQVISLKIGMKGSEAIAQAGIPCPPSTIKSIDDGDNVTLNYQGHSYVFSKGVLQAVH